MKDDAASTESFVFILNRLDFDSEPPFEVAPSHFLRRANETEVDHIRQVLNGNGFRTHFVSVGSYEDDTVEVQQAPRSGFKLMPLPREKWRYTVLSFTGYNDKIQALEGCANLLSPPLAFGFSVLSVSLQSGRVDYAYSWHANKIFAYLNSPERFGERAQKLSSSELAAFRDYFNFVDSRQGKDSFVLKAITSFDQCRALPSRSDAVALAYFGIIESLVTHIPNPTDTLDSIRRQLRNKMKLLGKRFITPLEPASYFDASLLPSHEKLWNKLYDYRSRLAHGGSADFEKEFKALKSRESVTRFLREAVRLLIIVGIREEEFLADLRDC